MGLCGVPFLTRQTAHPLKPELRVLNSLLLCFAWSPSAASHSWPALSLLRFSPKLYHYVSKTHRAHAFHPVPACVLWWVQQLSLPRQLLHASAAVVVLRAETEMRAALDQSLCSQCDAQRVGQSAMGCPAVAMALGRCPGLQCGECSTNRCHRQGWMALCHSDAFCCILW